MSSSSSVQELLSVLGAADSRLDWSPQLTVVESLIAHTSLLF